MRKAAWAHATTDDLTETGDLNLARLTVSGRGRPFRARGSRRHWPNSPRWQTAGWTCRRAPGLVLGWHEDDIDTALYQWGRTVVHQCGRRHGADRPLDPRETAPLGANGTGSVSSAGPAGDP